MARNVPTEGKLNDHNLMPTCDLYPKLEEPVLERLLSIRARLSVVKRDRSSYLKLEDFLPIRQEIEEEMQKLSNLRGGHLLDESRELNRTDDVLDEVLQMLSLSFLSLGKKREGKKHSILLCW